MTEQATELAPLNVPTSGVRDGLGAVQDIDEGKRQVLVDIPWEVIDSYNSDFSRDCFDEFLGQRMPAMCWQHQKTEPIGRALEWNKGARANQFVAQFSDFDAVPRARQAFAQIRDKEITDFSFYYDQARAIPHPNTRGAIRFTKARMPEISPVTVGSIPGAMATGIRQAADMAGVAELVRTRVITEEEGRAMLGLTGEVPTVGERQTERESITIGSGDGHSLTIKFDGPTIDGTIGTVTGERQDGEEQDASELALAVATALSATSEVLQTRSADNQDAVTALVDAATQANEDLLAMLGVDEADVRAAQEVVRTAREEEGVVTPTAGEGERAPDDGATDTGERAAEKVDLETQAALARLTLGRR